MATSLANAVQRRDGSAESRLAALQDVCRRLDELDAEGASSFCAELRQAGFIGTLVSVLSEQLVSVPLLKCALLALGNMCSDEVDPDAELTKAAMKASRGFTPGRQWRQTSVHTHLSRTSWTARAL